MDSTKLQVFTSEDLKAFTDDFNEKNLVGVIQFGKLYSGKINGGMNGEEARDVTVKTWDKKSESTPLAYDECLIIKEEVEFLTNPAMNGHPSLAKLIGYCCDEVKGVVYDFSPRDTLHILMVKDDLNWHKRMNVILQLARLLKFLHGQVKPYLVFSINASHIMLDWDLNPKLIDFGLIGKWIIDEMSAKKKQMTNPTRCIDPYFSLRGGEWGTSCEVYSFGFILLGLITKRSSEWDKQEQPDRVLENVLHIWAKMEYKPQSSLVHKSLQEDWGYHAADGIAITELGMHCIEFFPGNRPTMKDVAERLQNLPIFQRLDDSRSHKRHKKFQDYAMCMWN